MEISKNGLIYSGYSDKDKHYTSVQDSIPASFCLDDLGEVKNQGNKPWCSAYAALDALEYQFRCVGRRLNFDESDLYKKRSNFTEGMQPRDTFNILLNKGAKSREGESYIQYYARMYNLRELQSAIICNGPAYLALPIHSMISTKFWKGPHDFGGHAILAVGWNEEGILLKNTWGYEWANNGYVRMPYEDYDSILEAWTFVAKVI